MDFFAVALEERFRHLYRDLANIDISELASLYREDIEFIDPVTTHQGIDAVKQYFSKLLESVEFCQFDIHSMFSTDANEQHYSYVVEWTMQFRLKNKSNTISVDGVSLLKVSDEMIYYHRDYYDLGEMVYEHIPILSHLIRFIKKKLDT